MNPDSSETDAIGLVVTVFLVGLIVLAGWWTDKPSKDIGRAEDQSMDNPREITPAHLAVVFIIVIGLIIADVHGYLPIPLD